MDNGIFQIFHRAVPVGIEGKTYNIIIDFFYLQTGQQCIQLFHIIDVGVMYSHQNIFSGSSGSIPDSLTAGGQQFSNV